MSHPPVITIITPVWNGLPYLRECVESVLAQDFKDWEMIISDDGSTDGSRDYLKTLSDPRIRLFEQPANLGIFGNLNFLFKQARASISQILCQDDYLIGTTVLSRLLSFWKDQPVEVGFMRCNWGHDLGKCRLRHYAMEVVPSRVVPEKAGLLFFLFGNIPGNLANVSLRTRLVEECGWFREDLPYAGDFEFWSRAAQQYVFAVETANLIHVRQHKGAATFHLNRKGELVRQLHKITEQLVARLTKQYPTLRLKLYTTATYDSQHRNAALANWRKTGSWQYLSEVNHVANESQIYHGLFARWVVFFFTFGGRFGRVTLARRILDKTHLA